MNVRSIIVTGEKRNDDVNSNEVLEHVASYYISGATRGATEVHEIPVDEDSVLQWEFEDDTIWFTTASNVDEIFPDAGLKRSGDTTVLEIPTGLSVSDGARAGIFKKVLVKVVRIFAKKVITKKLVDFAENLELKIIDDRPGLFTVNEDFSLQPFVAPTTPNDAPYLLFLHGTASSTKKSFGKLEGSQTWTNIRNTYGDRILGFNHKSLTHSPLRNVVDLVQLLPKKCTVHIITQSHGGVVGETLSRFFNTDGVHIGFSPEEVDIFVKYDQAKDVEHIEWLKQEVSKRQITIGKFIRVASPAGGTRLASKRIDHLLNIIVNLLGFAVGGVNPVLIAFQELIGAAIDAKNSAEELPGIEALKPDSAFMKAVTHVNSPVRIDNSVAIISGNAKFSFRKALAVIATKLFFMRDNDFIVDTISMYSGTQRTKRVQYLFDEGSDVHHFNYFVNKRTVEALESALLKIPFGDPIPGFTERDITAFDAKRGILPGQEGGQLIKVQVSGTKPILLLLPGIMGSNLEQDNSLLWINYAGFLLGHLKKLEVGSQNITATSLVRTSYKKLAEHFSDTYDVVTFPYDWRMQLRTRAALLNDKIKELMNYNQPVKVIGHSMGGVLMRDFMVFHEDTWKILNNSKGFKLVFLGAPLQGSYRIPAVLFGQDSLITKLARIDIFHTKKELIEIFIKLPGLLSLLPHSKTDDFSLAKTWQDMRDASENTDWKIPPQSTLDEFRTYRDDIIAFEQNMDYTNISYVAGQDTSTPCGFRIDETSKGKELVFLSTSEGDQSVTWETGIPLRMISKDSVYYTNVVHGQLANDRKLFAGIAELLIHGVTNQLSRTRPITRAVEKVFRTPIETDFDFSQEGVEKTILGLEDASTADTQREPLKVSVTKGHLKFAAYPVLAGHFMNDGILYSEQAIDQLLNKELTRRHQLVDYPGGIGTSEVVRGNEDFPGALIVGIGETGCLTPYLLSQTVEEGVAKYLLELNSDNPMLLRQARPAISSLVIGCGYGGLTVESSVRSIVSGVLNGNDKIRKIFGENAKTIEAVEFVELYSDRALSTYYALSRIEEEHDPDMPIAFERRQIASRPGFRDRVAVDSTEGWWTRVNVQLIESLVLEQLVSKETSTRSIDSFRFTISTGGAREDVRDLLTSKELIDKMIKSISTDHAWTPKLAKTLFNLMIPNDFKERVKRQNNLNFILDTASASYPWELLQSDDAVNAKPLCINAGMIRQLATRDFNQQVKQLAGNKAIVIADPDLDGFVGQLPGANKEGQMVWGMLADNGYDASNSTIGGTSIEIIQRLLGGDEYKIIHLAGHGFFDEKKPEAGGMVIGRNAFLTTREISQMPTPELVFVNCCYLGKTSAIAEQYYQERYRLAANIGVQLIRGGVKVAIVAGWEVDDQAALKFTEVFYESMFTGDTFGEAIQKARIAAYEKFPGTNTWGAYQCYGDPFYRLNPEGQTNRTGSFKFVDPEEALIALGNLSNDIVVGQRTIDYSAEITKISTAVDKAVRTSAVTAKEASIYFELGSYERALDKFESLLKSENAGFTLTSMQEYCSLRSYLLVSADERPNAKAFDPVIKDVEKLLSVGATADRCLLMGNVLRKKASVLARKDSAITTYKLACYYYNLGASLNQTISATYCFVYFIETELLLSADDAEHGFGKTVTTEEGKYEVPGEAFVKQQLQRLRAGSAGNASEATDYKGILLPVIVDVCQWLMQPVKDPNSVAELFSAFRKAWRKIGSPANKQSEVIHFGILSHLVSLGREQDDPLKKQIDSLSASLKKLQ